MNNIRKARPEDASRIAEILVFTKRMNTAVSSATIASHLMTFRCFPWLRNTSQIPSCSLRHGYMTTASSKASSRCARTRSRPSMSIISSSARASEESLSSSPSSASRSIMHGYLKRTAALCPFTKGMDLNITAHASRRQGPVSSLSWLSADKEKNHLE